MHFEQSRRGRGGAAAGPRGKGGAMARTDARYRAAYNSLLDSLTDLAPQDGLASEIELARRLKVSRTIVRTALARLRDAGIVRWSGRDKTLIRRPSEADRLAAREDHVPLDELEVRFLDWVLRFDVPAGTPLNVSQLARTFGVAPHVLQEFLAGLVQYGLVARRPRGGWLLLGFTAEYAVELSEFRLVLEVNAVRIAAGAPEDHPVWARIADLAARHRALADRIATDFHDFSRLDEQFHTAVNSVVPNRFVAQFQKVITLIFHYHYQWDKTRERDRNEAAIAEHLCVIDALQSRDADAAVEAATRHLATSKETLLTSLRCNRLV